MEVCYKVYYVEFTQSDGTTEEHGLQPIVASSEAKALEYAKKVLDEIGDFPVPDTKKY